MSKRALALITTCFEKKKPSLYLGAYLLTDDDFEKGGLLDIALRKCTHLEKLSFSQGLSKYVTHRTEDSEFDDTGHALTHLPSALEALTNLSELIVTGYNLEARSSIEDLSMVRVLPSLRILDARFNVIKNIDLEDLAHLQIVNLTGNKITTIKGPRSASWIETLNIDHNNIKSFSLSGLPRLKTLSANGNIIRNIDDIREAPLLVDLSITNNGISDMSWLDGMPSLERLYLGRNTVVEIGPINLPKLKSLNINNNNIREIKGMAGMPALEQLYLEYNSIDTLREFECPAGLQYLALTRNSIAALKPFPDFNRNIGLNLQKNKIKELTTTEYLQLFSPAGLFSIEAVVREKNNAVKAQDFEAASQLRDIEKKLKAGSPPTEEDRIQFEALFVQWRLAGNPLTGLPQEVIRQGHDAILRYLQEKERVGTAYLYEAKMLLVGQPRAGKTSLRLKLFDSNTPLPVEEQTTRGIDIQQLSFDFVDENGIARKFYYNVWDFGGQQIYQTTHQFFLTQRSLYVLVMDTGKDSIGNDDATVNYWLQVTELLGENSPLLLVKNEKNERQVNIDLDQKKARFPFLRKDYNIDLNALIPGTKNYAQERLKDFKILKEDIELELRRLPLVGFPMPANWVDIRKALQQKSLEQPYISREEYIRICRQFDVQNFKAQMELSSIFHDLGVFLHFQKYDNLEDFIVLQNVWATDAVFAVLDNEAVKKSKGRFTDEDLAVIWASKGYEHEVHRKLLALMMRFELCYEIEKGKRSIYIVPEMLADKAPVGYGWREDKDLMVFYRYDFMPKGLLTRLIVRLNKYVFNLNGQQAVWKTGVKIDGNILDCPGTFAEITEAWDNKRLIIRAQGAYHKDLLNKITYEIDTLNDTYFKQLRPDFDMPAGAPMENRSRWYKMIPCNCDECKITDDKYFYDYHTLLKALTKVSTIQCQKSFDKVDIQGLIHDTFESNKTTRGKKIFISYSKQDLTMVNEFIRHLAGLKRDGKVDQWYCTELRAGSVWEEEIKKQFEESDIVCFMVSPHFMDTPYVQENEVTWAFQKKAGNPEFAIVPIILDFCKWTTKKNNLGQFTALPYTAKPVMDFKNHNLAWTLVQECLGSILDHQLDPRGDDFYTHQRLSAATLRLLERLIKGELDA